MTSKVAAITQGSPSKDGHWELLVQPLKAAADPLRLTVLQVLGQSSFGVLELSEMLGMAQSGMSHHLKVLAKAGLVETRREGNAIFYRRALATDALHQALLDQIDDAALEPAVAERVAGIQERRTLQSREYFAKLQEGQLSKEQELIADYPQYADLAFDLLTRACRHLGEQGGELAVEIGPGEGQFLLRLAPLFKQVVGYDNAPSMLARARQRIDEAAAANVELVLGEWPSVAPDQAQADAVVLNMVLHHMPAPADCLRSAARRLKPGAVMLVTELCAHDQQWAHESCGDVWLGFEEAELLAWAKRAGLEQKECQYLAQRNGFQVQVRTFVRNGLR